MKTILLIDDCVDYRETTAQILLEVGYEVWEATNSKDALMLLEHESFDLIVCDLHLPLADQRAETTTSYEVGVNTIKELRDLLPKVPIIAMSSAPKSNIKRISKFLDPIPAYSKPFHSEEILEIIDSHLSMKGAYGLVQ